MRQFLRQIKPGQEFVLLRTGERYRLISRGPVTGYGTEYRVLHLAEQRETRLHHACHVEPVEAQA